MGALLLVADLTVTALPEGALLLDVREPAEVAQGALKEAVNIPLHKLRCRASLRRRPSRPRAARPARPGRHR